MIGHDGDGSNHPRNLRRGRECTVTERKQNISVLRTGVVRQNGKQRKEQRERKGREGGTVKGRCWQNIMTDRSCNFAKHE